MPGTSSAIRPPFSSALEHSHVDFGESLASKIGLGLRTWYADRGLAASASLAIIYGILLSYLSILKHEAFNSTTFNLGFFDQALWNTLHGRLLHTSLLVASPGHNSYFAEHVSPILLPLSLLYLLGNDVSILLLFQAFTVGLSALPLYLLAKLRCGSQVAAVLLAAAYLALPTVVLNNLFDFNPDILVVPLLPLAFYLIHTQRYRAFMVTVITMLALEETMALTVFMLGLYAAFRGRRRALGLALAAGSLFWLFLCVNVVVPYFRGGEYHQLSRYQELGGPLSVILLSAVTDPLALVHALLQSHNITYLLSLLVPLAGLSVLSPLELTVALPMLLVNMLNRGGIQANLADQYSLLVASILFVAAIESIRRIQKWPTKIFRQSSLPSLLAFGLSLFILALTVLATTLIVVQFNSMREPFKMPANVASLAAVSALIPADASLATSNDLVPHFAHRQQLQLFPPLEIDGQLLPTDADYILVNLRDNGWSGIPEDHLSSTYSTNDLVDKFVNPTSYETIYAQNDVLLLHRR